MKSIARNASSSCTSPALDFWAVVDGSLTDLYSLEFVVEELTTGTQVWPVAGRGTVDVATTCPAVGAGRIAKGHYVAAWTVPADALLGRHRITWWMRTSASAEEQQYEDEFDVLPAGLRVVSPHYVLLSELREEGFDFQALPDARALSLIRSASLLVERYTGRTFAPQYRTLTLDGTRSPVLRVRDPIIAIESVLVDGSTSVDLSGVQVYNRHISQGLEDPDDRADPRLAFASPTPQVDPFGRSAQSHWWPGPRRITVEGLFGYTDPDDRSLVGVTPDLLKRIVMMLVARESLPLSDLAGRAEVARLARIKDERTRDQGVSYSDGGNGASLVGGDFTGDQNIDTLIAMFVAPMAIGVT